VLATFYKGWNSGGKKVEGPKEPDNAKACQSVGVERIRNGEKGPVRKMFLSEFWTPPGGLLGEIH